MLRRSMVWFTGMVTVLAAFTGGPDARDLARFGTYRHQEPVPEARIWLDGGVDPVLQGGDRVRVFYRSSMSAYVAIFQVDTDGTVRLLYPRSPSENHYARAGRDYRLLFPRSPYWYVGDPPGLGYFFIVTAPTPFDFSDFRYSYYDGGWDLSVVGSRVYEDPYTAMDDYVARLIPDWEYASYGLDFVSYSVGGAHTYPRFLCYDCHGFKPYNVWNPYHYTCANFRVVVYDDPYFYPSRRYRGDQVVFVGRSIPSGPRFGFKERGRGEPGTPIVRRVPAADRDDGSRAPEGARARAIPRAEATAPSSTRPSDARAIGGRDARAQPPQTRRGDTDRREDSSGAPPARPTPDAGRPVLERRSPGGARPSDGVRGTPEARVAPTRPGSSERVVPSRADAPAATDPVTRRRPSPPTVGKPSDRSAPRSPPAAQRPGAGSAGSSAPAARGPGSPPAARERPSPPAATRSPPRSVSPPTTRRSPPRSEPAPQRSGESGSRGSRPPTSPPRVPG